MHCPPQLYHSAILCWNVSLGNFSYWEWRVLVDASSFISHIETWMFSNSVGECNDVQCTQKKKTVQVQLYYSLTRSSLASLNFGFFIFLLWMVSLGSKCQVDNVSGVLWMLITYSILLLLLSLINCACHIITTKNI